ncbi:MAG TPA: N-acetylmuramoyl-L-alanine amidase [Burkholderiales bacterium]|nr:N-acetylmuramoyl-L-alanine amidase [Burkholderiales bacterium]
MKSWIFSLSLLAVSLVACAPMPERPHIPTKWLPSSNFDERRPNFVIIHHTTDDTAAEAIATLTDRRRKLSAHYLIARDGTIYQLVDERARAWHAGESYWGGNSDLNSSSLGIELDNNGDEPFSVTQIEALLGLLYDIKTRHRIPTANYLGHADVAPRRKADPSRYFPWKLLAEHGFGLWCDAHDSTRAMDEMAVLQALGYDVTNLEATIVAFKRHFVQHDLSPELTDDDRGVMLCLLDRKRALVPEDLRSRRF